MISTWVLRAMFTTVGQELVEMGAADGAIDHARFSGLVSTLAEAFVLSLPCEHRWVRRVNKNGWQTCTKCHHKRRTPKPKP